MNATKEWREYDHDYEKVFQDIRTKDGKEYINCWPNAGSWFVLTNKTSASVLVPDADVTHVKLTDEEV